MASTFRIVKEVFSNRNVLVISLTSMISFGIFNSLWNMWWSLYLLEALNASIPIVGLLAMLQNSSQLLFQLPGGFLADRFGRRRVIALGTSLRIVAPIVFLFAKSWEWVIPGIITNAAAAIYQPAFNALIAESLPANKRATAFGAYRMMTSIPAIFMPTLSGIYMDQMGLIQGVRIGLVLSFIVLTIAFVCRMLFLRETLDSVESKEGHEKIGVIQERRGSSFRGISSALRKLLGGRIFVMLIVSCIGGFGIRLVFSYLVIYGVEVIGLSKTQWGLLETVASAFGTSLYLVGGMIADRFGRVPCILLARILLPIHRLGLLFLRDYNQLLLLHSLLGIGAGLGGGSIRAGGFMGGPAWQALVVDLVPTKDLGKVMGLMGTITGLIAMPAPLLGGYMWGVYGPNALLILNVLTGLVSVSVILLALREPEKKRTLST